ncbi:DUF1254 domain-containing protein [Cupriavidus necator]|uniref:DUF1254 domain-containing protein n=2 Tax=Cupriavidus necator TaxID=106590 RepID=A0A367PHS8_CUPNE|nr:DUF1254 domain-containing protein [Cupriavidus necator]
MSACSREGEATTDAAAHAICRALMPMPSPVGKGRSIQHRNDMKGCNTGLTAVVLVAGHLFAMGGFLTATAPTNAATLPAEATADSRQKLAAEAAVWGMPIVSVDAMREAFFRDAGAAYNDIVFWSRPADWKNQTTTPNSSSLYVYFNFNLKDGPVALDLPAADGAGIFGSVLDAWQVPLADVGPAGEDEGRGGKYLLLPPGFKGDVPEGYVAVPSSTYNGYALLRFSPASSSAADVARAIELLKRLRLYPLAHGGKPPHQRFIDMDGKVFDGIVRYDESFYTRLARMVSEEPESPGDAALMARLSGLGIGRGKPFNPDPAMRAALRAGIQQAHAAFINAWRTGARPWWPGSRWGGNLPSTVGASTGFSFRTDGHLETDARGAFYYLAYAPPAKLGKATAYLTSWSDSTGEPLRGNHGYVLHVPPNVPARQFWAVTIYDVETAAFMRGSPRVNLDSYSHDMQRNADGSVDIYFGPKAPAGKEANWIYTTPGKDWFAAFRFYGPGKALMDKTWMLPDLVRQ